MLNYIVKDVKSVGLRPKTGKSIVMLVSEKNLELYPKALSDELATSNFLELEREHGILKDAEDYRAGCLETSPLAEVRKRLGHS